MLASNDYHLYGRASSCSVSITEQELAHPYTGVYPQWFCSISWKTTEAVEKLILKVQHFGSLLLLNLVKDEGKIPSQQQKKGAVSHSTFYIHIISTVSTYKLKITGVRKDACNWDPYLCLQWTTNNNTSGLTSSSPLLIDIINSSSQNAIFQSSMTTTCLFTSSW